jgi:hypothetical protein
MLFSVLVRLVQAGREPGGSNAASCERADGWRKNWMNDDN